MSFTPLWLAAENGRLATVEALLAARARAGAGFTIGPFTLFTPLGAAHDMDVKQVLRTGGAEPMGFYIRNFMPVAITVMVRIKRPGCTKTALVTMAMVLGILRELCLGELCVSCKMSTVVGDEDAHTWAAGRLESPPDSSFAAGVIIITILFTGKYMAMSILRTITACMKQGMHEARYIAAVATEAAMREGHPIMANPNSIGPWR